MMIMACFDYRSALPLMFLPYNIARRMPFFKKSVAGMKASLFVNFLAFMYTIFVVIFIRCIFVI
jgi:hypothetical protein